MSPEREEELLAIARDLAKRLALVPVPLLKDLGRAGREQWYAGEGVSPSCIGIVAAFLASDLEVSLFRRFVNLLDQMDPIVSQNQTHPKAENTVLKQELERLLSEQPNLGATELLYVLKWAQRLLPSKKPPSPDARKMGRRANKPRTPKSNVGAEQSRFNQLAEALRKLK